MVFQGRKGEMMLSLLLEAVFGDVKDLVPWFKVGGFATCLTLALIMDLHWATTGCLFILAGCCLFLLKEKF
jgi:hypothetical protein